jgi:hypothetical protein
MQSREILPVEECAFEPDSVEIRCVDCDKPTGVMGTCRDVDLCSECRASYVKAGFSKAEVSELLITMIEGRGYRAKFAHRRVLHLAIDGYPACGIKDGPHPMTTNRNETNCKRCVTKAARRVTHEAFDLMVIAIILILIILIYGNTVYSAITKSFAESGKKITNVEQVMKV